jgi:hypothetical protein
MSMTNRYRTIGELIGTSFSTGFKFLPMILAITALSSLFSPVNSYLSTRMTGMTQNMGSDLSSIGAVFGFLGIYFLVLMVQTALSYLLSVFLIREMNRYMTGTERPFDLGQSLSESVKVWIPALVAGFVSGIIIVLGTFLLIVPGLIFMCAFAVVLPVAAIENAGVGGSLERSWKLTKGNRMKIFGTLLLIGLIVIGILLVPIIIFEVLKRRIPGDPAANTPVLMIFQYVQTFVYGVVGTLIQLPATLLIFYNLKFLKEGSVNESLNTEFDKPVPGAEL